jgi:protein-S-isoprenylcysteine O-methyltransferase Ste14
VTREESGDQSFWAILPGFLAVFFGAPIESLVFPKDLLNDARIQIAGLALIAAGLLLHVWASYHLQELFSGHIQIKSGHRLVMNGPYRSIRHPVYAAYMVITLGVAVGFTSLVGMAAIALLLAPGLAYRMKVEEKLLEEEFGVVYQKYAAGTRRLVPWLW